MLSPVRRHAIQVLQQQQQQIAMKVPIFAPGKDEAAAIKKSRTEEATEASLRLLASKVQSNASSEGGARLSFLAWDKTRRGYLTSMDLVAVLASYGLYLNAIEATALFIRLDHDKDGKISFDDFATVMAGAASDDKGVRGGDGVIERRAVVALPLPMTVAGMISKGGAAPPGSELKAMWAIDSPRNTINHIREALRRKYPSNESGQLVKSFLKYSVVLPDELRLNSQPTLGHSLRLAPQLVACGSARRLVGPGAMDWVHGQEDPSGFRTDLLDDFGSTCESQSTKVLPAKRPYLTIASLFKGLQMDHAAPTSLSLPRLWELVLPYSPDAREALETTVLSLRSLAASSAGLGISAAPAGSATTTISISGGGLRSPMGANHLNRTTSTATTRVYSPSVSFAAPATPVDLNASGAFSLGNTLNSTGTTDFALSTSGFSRTGGDTRTMSVAAYPSPLPITAPSAVPRAEARGSVPSLPPSPAMSAGLITSTASMPASTFPSSSSSPATVAEVPLETLQQLAYKVGLTQEEYAAFANGSLDQARGITFSEDKWIL
jgi:hypothetical protein